MSIKRRIKAIEGRNGFKNERERAEYLKYAQMLDDNITAEDIQKPDDYIELAKQHFEPLPA